MLAETYFEELELYVQQVAPELHRAFKLAEKEADIPKVIRVPDRNARPPCPAPQHA